MTIANLTAICSSLRAENEFVVSFFISDHYRYSLMFNLQKLQNEQLATRINEMLQQSSGSFSNLWSPPTTLFNNPTLTPILSYQQSNFGDVQQSTKTPPANRESNEKSSVIATKLKVDQGKGTRDSVGDSFFEDLAVLQNNEVYQDFHPSENSWNHPVQKKKLRNQTKPSNTSVPPGIPQKTRSLAVNGVAKLSKRDILNYFSKFGTIELYTDPINNSARKFVFVRFSDYGTVDKIVGKCCARFSVLKNSWIIIFRATTAHHLQPTSLCRKGQRLFVLSRRYLQISKLNFLIYIHIRLELKLISNSNIIFIFLNDVIMTTFCFFEI